jgi:hypothetical protein
MTETKTGGCHCKAVRYEAELDLKDAVLECNCSHCQTKGFLLNFLPSDKFKLLSGEDKLTEYRFNTEKIAHLFCKVCGVQCFAKGEKDGEATWAVNVRTIDGIEPAELTKTPVNGRAY